MKGTKKPDRGAGLRGAGHRSAGHRGAGHSAGHRPTGHRIAPAREADLPMGDGPPDESGAFHRIIDDQYLLEKVQQKLLEKGETYIPGMLPQGPTSLVPPGLPSQHGPWGGRSSHSMAAGHPLQTSQLHGHGSLSNPKLIRSFPSTHPAPNTQVPQAPLGFSTTPAGVTEGTLLAGRYCLERQIGEGHLGQIFVARDVWETGEVYALKVLHPWLAHEEHELELFTYEYLRMKKLNHPGIVRTHLLERDPSHHAWFVLMEYVEGPSLQTLLQSERDPQMTRQLSLQEILMFFAKITPVLRYLHSKRIVHRDLKPSHILWTEPNGHGQLKLIGLGMAASFSGVQVSSAQLGRKGASFYTAPERMFEAECVTLASDIFSLGVLLYQMLTGTLPIGMAAMPSQLMPHLPSSLDELLRRALDPQWNRRFATIDDLVGALKASLFPLLSSEPVAPEPQAAPPKPTGRRRRQQAPTHAAPTIHSSRPVLEPHDGPSEFTAEDTGLQTSSSRESIEYGKGEFDAVSDTAFEVATVSTPQGEARQLAPQTVGAHPTGPHRTGPHRTGPHPAVPVSAGPHLAGPHLAGPHLAGPHSVPPSAVPRSVPSSAVPRSAPPSTAPRSTAPKTRPRENKLTQTRSLRKNSPTPAETGQVRPSRPISNSDRLGRLRKRLVSRTAQRPRIQTKDELDLALVRPPRSLSFRTQQKDIVSLAFSPDGCFLASISSDNTLKLWEVPSWYLLHTIPLGTTQVRELSWGPHGKWLAYCDEIGVTIRDVMHPDKSHSLSAGSHYSALSWSHDGEALWVGDVEGQICRWKMGSVYLPRRIRLHTSQINAMLHLPQAVVHHFSPDPKELLLTGGQDGNIRLWDLHTHEPLLQFQERGAAVCVLAQHPQQPLILSGNDRGEIQYWEPEFQGQTRSWKAHDTPITSIHMSPHGHWFLSADTRQVVKMWRTSDAELLCTFTAETSPLHAIALSNDSQWLALCNQSDEIKLWDIAGWNP